MFSEAFRHVPHLWTALAAMGLFMAIFAMSIAYALRRDAADRFAAIARLPLEPDSARDPAREATDARA